MGFHLPLRVGFPLYLRLDHPLPLRLGFPLPLRVDHHSLLCSIPHTCTIEGLIFFHFFPDVTLVFDSPHYCWTRWVSRAQLALIAIASNNCVLVFNSYWRYSSSIFSFLLPTRSTYSDIPSVICSPDPTYSQNIAAFGSASSSPA